VYICSNIYIYILPEANNDFTLENRHKFIPNFRKILERFHLPTHFFRCKLAGSERWVYNLANFLGRKKSTFTFNKTSPEFAFPVHEGYL